MKIHNTDFDQLKIIEFGFFRDERGLLLKPWISSDLKDLFGSNAETYITSSEEGTIRGLHFQKGNSSQKKYVSCLEGTILDISVDLRRESATYGRVFTRTLQAMDGFGVLIPEGFAHGIFAFRKSTVISFSNNSYSPAEEGGILWSSIDELSDLPVRVISDKDKNLPSLDKVLSCK
jgi:dTDP-4-dehydrorhamnose 3,5-epimerase